MTASPLTTAADAEAPSPGARRILCAAAELFARQGYAGTSIADVARAAEVSKATVFHHFRSKQALYTALLETSLGDFVTEFGPLIAPGESLGDALERFTRTHQARLRDHAGIAQLFLREMLDPLPEVAEALASGVMSENAAWLLESLKEAQRAGRIRADADCGLAAFLLISSSWFRFQAQAYRPYMKPTEFARTPESFAKGVADLLLNGLLPRAAADGKRADED
jgi:TetR/AcrR family transcriptional regulator